MLGGLAVSAAMAVQDQCGGSRSNSILPAGNGVSLNAGLHVVTGSRLNEQFSCGNDFSPKVRKPYTITKQRERWTEEEHKKFLEALKLYGRAWRRIEEHVGSKTAVQIRSHAQKFFSKVVRESSGSGTTTSPEDPIEIPPPRPKRKPMHPYPRKMLHPLNKEVSTSEQPQRSPSPNLCISDHENQSPTSVLSVVCSDALGSTDSNTPNCSLSPISCAGGSPSADLTISEPNLTPEDDGSRSAAMTIDAAQDDTPKVQKLASPKEDVPKDGLVEETSTRSLKLFGRTVIITECHGDEPAYQTIGSPKLYASCTNDVNPVQAAPGNLNATDVQPENGECTWGHLPQASGGLYYLQFQKENSNPAESGSAATQPWWAHCGGLPFSLGPFPKQETVKVILDSKEEIQKEGSWTGSNSGSVNEGENVDKNKEIEFYNEEKEHKPILELKPIERSGSSSNCMKGFVPYKKRPAERDNQSTALTGELREEQRIRLSL